MFSVSFQIEVFVLLMESHWFPWHKS